MNRWTPLFLASTLALALTNAPAGQIVLRTGEVIQGEVLEETPEAVKVRTSRTTLSITRDRIQEIRPSQPGEIEMLKAQDLLVRNQFDEAKAMLNTAPPTVAETDAFKALLAKINSAITKRDLEKYRSLLAEARSAASRGVESPALGQIRQILNDLPPDSPTRTELIDVLCSYHESRAREARDKVRNTEAVTELRAIIELDPNRPDPHLGLGDLYRSASATWEQAIYHFQRALELGKDRLSDDVITRIHWELGELYRQQRKYREAAVSYRQAYQRRPQFNLRLTDRMVEVMQAYADELTPTNPAMALAVIDEALKARTTSELLMLRGTLLATNKRWDESTASIEQALALTPRIRDAHYKIALNFKEKGEIFKTRESLQREVDAYSDHYDALCLLGNLALDRDDNVAAKAFFLKALASNKDRSTATLGLSRVYRRNKELAEAKKYAMEVLARDASDRAANLEMGNIYLDEGNNEEARRYFTSVLELVDKAMADPQTKTPMAELLQLKADALLARGAVQLLTAGPGTATQNFRDALEVIPNYPAAYFSIGNAYRKKFGSSKVLSDLKEAETNLLKARELAPQNAQYALEAGILYSQQLAVSDKDNEAQHRKEAVKHWRDYITLGGADIGKVEAWIREIEG
jgi:tetratricopeptide (TPR) repeat protein